MKLQIPKIGQKIILMQDWYFKLYAEYRNRSLMMQTGLEEKECSILTYTWRRNPQDRVAIEPWVFQETGLSWREFVIPEKTVLTIDRIYIRKGQQEFDSVSFTIPKCKAFPKRTRFWAKLDDVNNIHFEFLT